MSAQPLEIIAPSQDGVSLLTPMDMLGRALAQNAPIEILERLVVMQERWEANQARKAFEAARAAAKAEIPTITKNRTVDFTTAKGRTHYNFEDLAEIARTIDPILGKYGLSYHWRTSSTPGEPIIVTCFLTHRDGHSSDGNTLSASRDESGNKNGIQGIGSTVTYLQRYTLKAALGLSAAKDDDGVGGAGQNGGGGEADTARTAPPRYLTDAQASTLTQLLSDTKGNPDLFLRLINKPNIQAILAQDFDRMVALINNTANKRNEREAAQREAQRIAAMAEGGAV